MKVKKILFLMITCIICVSLVGCGSESSSDTSQGVVEENSQKEQEKEDTVEKVFVDDENCTFKISGIEEDNIWGYTLKAELENKTDKNLMFSFQDVSVNGYMCDPFWAQSVQAGKKAKSDISFSSGEFEELGIEKVEEIEFTLSVYDEDDWLAAHFVDEKFVFTIEK